MRSPERLCGNSASWVKHHSSLCEEAFSSGGWQWERGSTCRRERKVFSEWKENRSCENLKEKKETQGVTVNARMHVSTMMSQLLDLWCQKTSRYFRAASIKHKEWFVWAKCITELYCDFFYIHVQIMINVFYLVVGEVLGWTTAPLVNMKITPRLFSKPN